MRTRIIIMSKVRDIMIEESLNKLSNNDVKPIPISAKEAFIYIQKGALILDIRKYYETNYCVDFPEIIYLPYDSYKDKYNSVPKERDVVIVDNVGLVSSDVGRFLISKGYNRVFYIGGGIIDLDDAGLPLKKDLNYELNGGCACQVRQKNKNTNI